MTKVSRRIFAKGVVHVVEAAARADSSAPAQQFLRQLELGAHSTPDCGLPESDQVHDYHRLMAMMRYFSNNGLPQYHGMMNSLGAGLWEFKAGTCRLVFFDTDGTGRHEPKLFNQVREAVDPGHDDDFWKFPDFDDCIRLTNGFFKDAQQAPPEEIALAAQIRTEDLAHDKQ